MFFFFRKNEASAQTDCEAWREQWRQLVPPECRDVPITVEGKTEIAFVQINQFVMMLQDGLLMEASFFDVCRHFQNAGYHVIWLMRCTQDMEQGYLKKQSEDSERTKWLWKSPTTNFGRWTSDNFNATIILQHKQAPDGNLRECEAPILQRVTWAKSDDDTKMIPGKTNFVTVKLPNSPRELRAWLEGTPLSQAKKR
ncbi:MAG: hypothetical protein E7434_03240 [Ruminococcaceae bacterium]|nr:hypothetical protein [Oscillospiraceae bacterium]